MAETYMFDNIVPVTRKHFHLEEAKLSVYRVQFVDDRSDVLVFLWSDYRAEVVR